MKKTDYAFIAVFLIVLLLAVSCSRQGDKQGEEGNSAVSSPVAATPQSSAPALAALPSVSASPLDSFAPKFGKTDGLAPQGLAAEVNGKRLTAMELEARVAAALAKMKFRNVQEREEQRARIRERLRNDFIVRTLLEGEIERQKIVVPSSAVDKEIDKIKASLSPGGSLDEFLQSRGVNYSDFRKEVIFGLHVAKMVESHRPAQVTAVEIDKFYKQNKEKFVSPELAKIRHILIAVPPDLPVAQKQAKRALAENLRKQLANGADFASLARSFSDCPSKNKSGELGYLPRERLEENFAKVAFNSKIGEISAVVATSFGFHIIQTMDKQPPRALPLDARLRTAIAAFIVQQKRAESFHNLINKLKANAQIKIG